MRILAVCACLLLSPLLAFAEDFVVPKQAIVGADKPIPLGELADLSVSPVESAPKELVATSLTWYVLDLRTGQEKRFRTYENGIFFGTGLQKAKLKVVCAVTHLYAVKDDTGRITKAGTRTVLLVQEVTIGEGEPGPTPPIPVPPVPLPDGQFGLAKFAYANAAKVPEHARVPGCKALAPSFRGVAAAINAGTIRTPEDALKKVAEANVSALKNNSISADDFKDFSTALQDHLYDMYKNGKLKTVADFATAWNEIADGLEAVK